MKIKNIFAREILDSRANPTIECTICCEDGIVARASVPSGASVGKKEAVELRDGDIKRYGGLGVLKAIENIEKVIAPKLIGKKPGVLECDKIMCELDGSENKKNLGANAILAISIAVARAQALVLNIPDYELIQKLLQTAKCSIPSVMFNVLNGGAHADNKICFQEFMIMPVGHESFSQSLQMTVSVYKKLKELLIKKNYSTGIGDEGGFAPSFNSEKQALDFLLKSVELAGFKPGRDIVFCLDVAASNFFSEQENLYLLNDEKLSSIDLIDRYKSLVDNYPIFSIEDGLCEDDWGGFKLLTQELGEKVMLVGDDVFVTNQRLIKKGIKEKVANAVLIKPNQIGTVSQCLDSIKTCEESNYKTVVSHRSGETNDYFISDLAVGVGSKFFKAGAPVRGERVAKYNRLLRIEKDRSIHHPSLKLWAALGTNG